MTLGALGGAVGFLIGKRIPLLRLMIDACAVAGILLLKALLSTEGVGHGLIHAAFAPAVIFLLLFLFGGKGRPSLTALFLMKHFLVCSVPGRAGWEKHGKRKQERYYGKQVSHSRVIEAKDNDFRRDNAFARVIILLYISASKPSFMRTLKLFICMTMLAAAAGCGGKQETTSPGKPAAEQAYQCPMKCTEPVADPGKCPKCGMDMEKVNPS